MQEPVFVWEFLEIPFKIFSILLHPKTNSKFSSCLPLEKTKEISLKNFTHYHWTKVVEKTFSIFRCNENERFWFSFVNTNDCGTCNVCFHAPVIISSKHFHHPLSLIVNTSTFEVLLRFELLNGDFLRAQNSTQHGFLSTKPQHEQGKKESRKKSSCKINQWDFSSSNELSCRQHDVPWWIKYLRWAPKREMLSHWKVQKCQ